MFPDYCSNDPFWGVAVILANLLTSLPDLAVSVARAASCSLWERHARTRVGLQVGPSCEINPLYQRLV